MSENTICVGGQVLSFAPCEKCGSTAVRLGSFSYCKGRATVGPSTCGNCGSALVALMDGQKMAIPPPSEK